MSIEKSSMLLDEFLEFIGLHDYSIHTEQTCCNQVENFIQFYEMKTWEEFSEGQIRIEAFLTHFTGQRSVCSSIQTQPMNALIFLYKHNLKQQFDKEINAERACKSIKIPIALPREKLSRIIARPISGFED